MNKQSAILTEQDFRDAISKQCGFPTDDEVLRSLQFAMNPLQLTDPPPESERQILRCAPPFDAQAEHENDLRQESLRDFYEQEAE